MEYFEMCSTKIQNQNSLRDYIISQLGDDYLDAGHGELRYKCPICEEEGRTFEDYKMYVHYLGKKAGLYWCHRCEAKGRITLDDTMSSGSTTEVYPFLLDYINNLNHLDEEEESDYFIIPKTVPTPNTMAWDYLINRGITPDLISYYNIRVSGLKDDPKLYGRIVIPNRIYSKNWTDVYVARSYIGDSVRYKNPKSSRAHELVFNLHNIEVGIPSLIINEGVINSIIAGRNSIATFGKHVSNEQLRLILEKRPDNIYVSLDTDAYDLALKLCQRITQISKVKVHLVELPDGKDASDLGKSEYLELVNSSKLYESKSIYLITKSIASIGAK